MLSVIIITLNEEEMIEDCLISVEFTDEIIVVDSGNTDRTNEIAAKYHAKIVKSEGPGYAQFRNDGLKSVRGSWILYVDADERVTPLLRNEILETISVENSGGAYKIPRASIFLGKKMSHGGWGDDYVIRLFSKKSLTEWQNDLHEQPIYSGELKKLTQPLNHFSHRDLSSMLEKTLMFTKYESDLRYTAQHPQMSVWRFIRVMLTEFWLRFVKLSAWKDGIEGVIDGIFQVFNMFIIYARLWEKQRNENSRL